jgi:pimeloyl-ACP methyl ester carboxylesterase/DNA-binding CsgD family transcriptional regulator
MDQELDFLELRGRRIAYATNGAGPPLVIGPRWVWHLREEWDDPAARAFFSELGRTFTVVRFDRIGCGLSSRELDEAPLIESETRQLEAVVDAVGGRAVVFATSCCSFAATQLAVRRPEAVEKLVYFGGYASRADIPEVTKTSLVQFVATNWRLGAQLLAALFDPHASGDQIAELTRKQRAAASAETAAAYLEAGLNADARDLLPHVHAPTLVLHRRGDRVIPLARGRELASLLPNARFVPLSGDSNLPWRDDQREIFRALAGFLHADESPDLDGASPLTSRETEVLRLVATGMSNREIASTLVLSEHTVHRHVANILRKLSQSTRAAAATQAARAGLI